VSKRPWIPFYFADYTAKTEHLTVVEHGAYFLLMKHYYMTRHPLPADTDRLLMICRAFADHEKAAVMNVLGEFFVLDRDHYRHPRIEEELMRASEICEKKAAAGKMGAAATNQKIAAQKRHMPTHSYSHSQPSSQDTKDEEKPLHASACPNDVQPNMNPEGAAGKSRRGSRIPDSFAVTEEHREFARKYKLPSPDLQIDEFRDNWRSQAGNRGVKLDWDATFRNWLRHAAQYGGRKKMVGMREPSTPEQFEEMKKNQLERNPDGTYRIK